MLPASIYQSLTLKQVITVVSATFTLGVVAFIALIGVAFFATIILLSWLLNMALSFLQALGEHLLAAWTTGDDFTKALIVLILGYIAFRMVVPHVRTLINKR